MTTIPPQDSEEIVTLQEQAEIVRLLQEAVGNRTPVTIHLPESEHAYFTTFITPTMEEQQALEKGSYLLANQLGPFEGNSLIRQGMAADIRFFTEQSLIHLVSRYYGETADGRSVKLVFPERIDVRPQRRSAPRHRASDEIELKMTVMAESGEQFKAKVRDVSSGGISFCAARLAPELERVTARLRLESAPFFRQEFEIGIFDRTQKKERSCYRAYFVNEGEVAKQRIETLVNYVESRTPHESGAMGG